MGVLGISRRAAMTVVDTTPLCTLVTITERFLPTHHYSIASLLFLRHSFGEYTWVCRDIVFSLSIHLLTRGAGLVFIVLLSIIHPLHRITPKLFLIFVFSMLEMDELSFSPFFISKNTLVFPEWKSLERRNERVCTDTGFVRGPDGTFPARQESPTLLLP